MSNLENRMFFRRLEDLRIDHDMTQQQVAEAIGLSREVYRRYEKGIRTIPVDVLIDLADHYDVSLDYISERREYSRKAAYDRSAFADQPSYKVADNKSAKNKAE